MFFSSGCKEGLSPSPFLERDFQRRRIFERVRREYGGLWLGLAFSLGVATLRACGVGPVAESWFSLALRFSIVLIFLGLLVLVRWWSRLYVRRHDLILGGALLAAGIFYMVIRIGALYGGSESVAAPALVTVVAHLLLLSFAGLSVPWLVVVTLPLDLAILASFAIVEPAESFMILFLLLIATLGGVLARLELDGRSRQVFYQQRALREAKAQIDARQKMLLDAIAKKEQLLAFIAHDMRQPLLSLAIHRESLASAVVKGELSRVAKSVESIGECVRFMQLNTDRLLDLPDGDRASVQNLAAVDVRRLLDSIASISTARAAAGGVVLRVRTPIRDGPFLARSDEAMLAEIVSNLVDNGIKYQAGRDARRECWVLLGVVRVDDCLRVDVVDNGIGIARRAMERIFDFGWRDAHVVAADRVSGKGLGLASVAAAVRTLPGHRISVCSRLGMGTRFSVHMPRA